MVVTIVVLLILAGVSISLVVSNNGVIQRSKEAGNKYGQAKYNEATQIDAVSDWIDEQVTGKKSNVVKTFKEKKDENSTINGEEGSSKNPTIPAGYVPINTETSNWGDGSTAPTQDSVDHGLVIRDDNNNEWVWIPVPDVTIMCDTENETEYTLCGTEGETAVKTTKYSKTIRVGTEYVGENLVRTTPGTTGEESHREPDLAIGSDGTEYDAQQEYYNGILGFESKEKMAEAFVADYNEMIASIGRYGGFYIGRYELSAAGVQKDKATLTNTNWYSLYKKCKELKASDKVETRMVWGCQWDVTCNFIANYGEEKDIKDSRDWENCKDSITPANTGNYEIGTDGNAIKKNTGSNEAWKANNIYDFAGNCVEYTQEINDNHLRVDRGGCCNSYGTQSGYAAWRGDYGNGSDFEYSDLGGTRPTLIINMEE